MMQKTFISSSPEETFRLGEKLGRKLTGGEVVCLYGELGAGKTVLAKGLGKGLGVTGEIISPTFTLIQEYPLASSEDMRFIHMDLYRLNCIEEAEVIGVTDFFQDDCVCLIEWPEIISELLPPERLEIRIEGSGESPRTIFLNGAAGKIFGC